MERTHQDADERRFTGFKNTERGVILKILKISVQKKTVRTQMNADLQDKKNIKWFDPEDHGNLRHI
jgi:hypothetical protein